MERYSLPDSVVDADTLNTFKSRLDKQSLDQDVLYNFHSGLTGTGGASICMCRPAGHLTVESYTIIMSLQSYLLSYLLLVFHHPLTLSL